jgi:hypothetical protein
LSDHGRRKTLITYEKIDCNIDLIRISLPAWENITQLFLIKYSNYINFVYFTYIDHASEVIIIEMGVTTNKYQQKSQFNLHRKREQIERKEISKVLKQWTYQRR